MNRLKTEYDRFLVRESKLAALGDTVKPLVKEQHDRAYQELNSLIDRASTIRQLQKHIIDVFELVDGIDFHVRATNKKQVGDENVPPERLAILKLASYLGASKVRRVDTGETIRVNFLDDFKSLSDRRTLFFFSTKPRPGVFAFPLDGREVSLSPVYEPITTEEKK